MELCHLKVPLLLAGVFSMYFHMTLSYVGQLLDELSILWTLAVAYSFWYPQAYFPKCIKTRYEPEGHGAGSEGRDGTLTLRCSDPQIPQFPCKGSALRSLKGFRIRPSFLWC